MGKNKDKNIPLKGGENQKADEGIELNEKDAFGYEKLLARAWKNLPKTVKNEDRFTIPVIELIYEGKTSVILNMAPISKMLNRDMDHIFSYLLREVGTAGNISGQRGILKGQVPRNTLNNRFKKYIETYVLCSECVKPDTRMVKDGRTQVLQCDACGAHRPIKTKRTTVTDRVNVERGSTLDVIISDIGKRGDGVARLGEYIIFVQGVTKGSRVQIMVTNMKGNLVFGKKIKDL